MNRQIAYLVGMGVLLTVAWLWRDSVVNPNAEKNGLREQDVGNVEVTGRAVELALTGSRGMAVAYLWYEATELQKKNRWNEVELVVRSLTKLQPHFITPWLFQSWNFAYNVYAEVDRPREKLYYLSRGCEMLAEGDRRNRFNPDLRFNLGLYQQHKINQSDETNIMRSLFQLACVPPAEREPRRFQVFDERGVAGEPGAEVRWNRFQSTRDEIRKSDPLAEWRLRLRLARKAEIDTILNLPEEEKAPQMIPADLAMSATERSIAWMDKTEQGNTGLFSVPPLAGGLWGAMGSLPLLTDRVVVADGTLIPETRFEDYRKANPVDAALAGLRAARGDKVLELPVATTQAELDKLQKQRDAIDPAVAATAREKLLARFDRAERELEAFCLRYPTLVRRLKEGTRPEYLNVRAERGRGRARRRTQFVCDSADAFIRFLDDSQAIPSLYDTEAYRRPGPNGWRAPDTLPPLNPNLLARFPSVPGKPDRVPGVNEEYDPAAPVQYYATKTEQWLNDQFDAWAAALAWYRYAQEPLPKAGEFPGSTRPIEDRVAQRKPKNMAAIIFRTQPGLMQEKMGQRLMQEGWFDADEGDNDPARSGSNLAQGPGGGYVLRDWIANKALVLGKGSNVLAPAIAETERVWREIAKANKMVIDPLTERNMDNNAKLYRDTILATPEVRALYEGSPERLDTALRSAPPLHEQPDPTWSPELSQSWHDHYYLREYDAYRQMSNFGPHYVRALAEKNPAFAIARKRFFEADTLSRFQAMLNERDALKILRRPDALVGYREKVLLEPKQRQGWFTDTSLRVLTEYGKEDVIQEDNYLLEMRYSQLAKEQEEPQISAAKRYLARAVARQMLAGNLAGAAAGNPALGQLASVAVQRRLDSVLTKLDEQVPFAEVSLTPPMLDYYDQNDWPRKLEIISSTAKSAVEGRDGEVAKNRPPTLPLPPRE